MTFHSAIWRTNNLDITPAALVAALQYILMKAGGWQPPHQTQAPLKSLIDHCDRGSCNEGHLLKQARKSCASLITVRTCASDEKLSVDIAYNAGGFWLWHRDLELWVSGGDGTCWLIPSDPFVKGMHWTVISGALIADDLAPFACGEARMHGVDAGRRLIRHLVGGM